MVSFEDTGLTVDEISYIQDECEKIMNRITELPKAESTEELVKEYYEFE